MAPLSIPEIPWVEKPWGRMKTYCLNERATVVFSDGTLWVHLASGASIAVDGQFPIHIAQAIHWSGSEPCTVKMLEVQPGHRLSDQRHAHRTERWTILTSGILIDIDRGESPMQRHPEVGEVITIAPGTWHRISCESQTSQTGRILEVSTGEFSEDDIERRSDDYGR